MTGRTVPAPPGLDGREAEDRPGPRQRLRPGTIRRIVPYVRPYRWLLLLLMTVTLLGAGLAAFTPVLFGKVIDEGIVPRRMGVVVGFALTLAGLALLKAGTDYVRARMSAGIGQGLIFDLRVQAYAHVQEQSLAFFTRTQTGALVSRLNTDVVGAQQAVTVLLSQTAETLLTLVLVLVAMFYLSWQLAVAALLTIPFLIFPAKIIGGRLERLTRETMQLNAEMGSLMNERFNVAGAMLVKLYGRRDQESTLFTRRARRVRDVGVRTDVTGETLALVIGLASTLALALMLGVGGALVVNGEFQVGTLVAMITLLTMLYGPVNQLSSLPVGVLVALVSFDRVFEVLDLKPLVAERPEAKRLRVGASAGAAANGHGAVPEIEFHEVSFRYPNAAEVSLASLESISLPVPERSDKALILNEVSFLAPAGRLTALVGPSGAGKTTITHLVPRFYDPVSGTVRIGGHDIRDLTLTSLRDSIGVVTQDAHLFHDTIRANLLYARPDASEPELVEACDAARIWDLIASLPDGLDTMVGDQGYRMSGGEKQRIALARLLLKAPPIVVLDEATAHLDSASEAAIQSALKTALTDRTSLVIAHRLSTIRDADQILVVDGGRIVERGTHEVLLEAGGLYADLYDKQFVRQAGGGSGPTIS
ncbi:ABC transporter ATP-binding protein [Streptomyces phyllanthi]|uniref:ABC transporter ATP-binding protein n=1 Tax=Streptomyces phyllanthi TaxID=1803180 RepID=A0A5N8VY35_9ACTN|nr:ABC transporter ATP-binding protein [Streptomyces phyllanthi]MPY39616.1 ABC transporter ATP-binding protein [Streptomyces phyllanthi]